MFISIDFKKLTVPFSEHQSKVHQTLETGILHSNCRWSQTNAANYWMPTSGPGLVFDQRSEVNEAVLGPPHRGNLKCARSCRIKNNCLFYRVRLRQHC
jgi:hypothetical protein